MKLARCLVLVGVLGLCVADPQTYLPPVNGFNGNSNGAPIRTTNGNGNGGNGFATNDITRANGNGLVEGFNGDPIEALSEAIGGGGVPGVDYPILAEVPDTGFTCDNLIPGYYADTAPEAGCQEWSQRKR
ncbi:hypothetical protein E2C01_048810 [Portunus trituberculatus]|uniref:Uncharacterized protein n=1 Tax=Portunus trituberculatus TaxID=210409 RepID=A0A5B7G4P4_PORTR|nr:hypothetical protein [Portunus trituberculatus]